MGPDEIDYRVDDDCTERSPSLGSPVRVVGDETSSFRQYLTVLIICLMNLINFMDRYATPGILTPIMDEFELTDVQGGLLQSAFVVSYVVAAPLVGYLGDRYSRKLIMAVGVSTWALLTLAGSFSPTFGWFIAFRCLSGLGEASYSTIGPAIISDLFRGDQRSKMLAAFYFTTPVGGGLGFISGSGMASLTGQWRWGLRVAPLAALGAVVLVAFVLQDPPRGQSEGAHMVSTPWSQDMKYILKNKSFMLSTLGSVGVTFVAGAFAAWGPKYIDMGQRTQGDDTITLDEIALIFGVMTILAGVLGVLSGSLLAQKLRLRYPTADAFICGLGLLCSAPLFYGALVLAVGPLAPVYVLFFIAMWCLCLNWALVGDILLYVVIPTRRSTAEAVQIVTCHVLGDAGSPFLIGLVSDALKPLVLTEDDSLRSFKALQYALLGAVIIEVIGSFFFLATSWYLVADKAKAERAIQRGAQPLHLAVEYCGLKGATDGSNQLQCLSSSMERPKPDFLSLDVL